VYIRHNPMLLLLFFFVLLLFFVNVSIIIYYHLSLFFASNIKATIIESKRYTVVTRNVTKLKFSCVSRRLCDVSVFCSPSHFIGRGRCLRAARVLFPARVVLVQNMRRCM